MMLAAHGLISFYGHKFHGHKTASGKIFNMYAFTCAHKHFKFGTRIKVTRGKKSVIVTVTDRGPYVKNRVIDLSYSAAKKIGITGVADCKYEVVK